MFTEQEIRTALQTGNLRTLEQELDAQETQTPTYWETITNLIHTLTHN